MRRPCSGCGELRTVVAKSLSRVVCHKCRRAQPRGAFDRQSYDRARRQAGLTTPPSYRKRAQQYGVSYEPINRIRVFNRDRWRCGICKRKVDKALKWPHPMSASLDHIVPMSRGGNHSYLNVQCAHIRCNIAKRDRGGGEQLALIA